MYFTHHTPSEADSKSTPLIANEDLVEIHNSEEANPTTTTITNIVNTPISLSTTSSQSSAVQFTNSDNNTTKSVEMVAPARKKRLSDPNKIMNVMSQRAGFSSTDFVDFDSSRQAIYLAFVAILAYLGLGTLVFSLWVDGWTAVDALYYTVATFTTIGYGDLYPETLGQRIFGIFFITGGIMIIGGVVFGILFDHLFSMFEKSVNDHKDSTQSAFINKFHNDPSQAQHGAYAKAEVFGSEAKTVGRDTRSMYKNIIMFSAILTPALLIGHYEEWTVGESIYFSIVTATTVGYGDLSPQHLETRLVAVFYLPICVGVMAQVFSQITSIYLDRKAKETENKFLNRTLTAQDLERMDFGGDGTVNREEFLAFMLVAMGKVDQDSILQIKDLFEKLDQDDDGCLDMSDVMVTAYGDEEIKTQRVVSGRFGRKGDGAV